MTTQPVTCRWPTPDRHGGVCVAAAAAVATLRTGTQLPVCDGHATSAHRCGYPVTPISSAGPALAFQALRDIAVHLAVAETGLADEYADRQILLEDLIAKTTQSLHAAGITR